MTKILIDEAVVRQALEAMEYADACLKKQLTTKTKHEYAQDLLLETAIALRAALEPPPDFINALKFDVAKREFEQPAQQCVCGEPETSGTHRTDGPCYAEQPAQQEPVGEVLNERGEVDWISFVPAVGTALYTRPQAREPEQPAQQGPVAWMWQDGTLTTDPDRADGTWTPLYTRPQPTDLNLNCKSVQARLATQWGYVKAEQADEPFGYFTVNDYDRWEETGTSQYGKPLYERLQKAAWVGLTQQDIDIAFDDTQEGGGFDDFARAIEANLREKNGGGV